MKTRVALVALSLVAGCGASSARPSSAPPSAVATPPPAFETPPSASARVTPDAPFRQAPPEPGPVHLFQAPGVTEARLKNGIRVAIVPTPSPNVALRIVASGGVADVGGAHVETARLMAIAMLLESKTRDRHTIEAALSDCLMPRPDSGVYPDAVVVSARIPVAKLDTATGILAELVFHPTFDKAFERSREQLERARETESNDATIAERELHRVLFGAHDYSAIHGAAAAVHAISRAEVVAAHDRIFDPSRLTIVAVGGLPAAQILSVLDASFGQVVASASAPARLRAPAPTTPAPPSGPRLVVVDRPGASMATVYSGLVAPPAASADTDALRLGVRILAGAGTGRLTLRLRDELRVAPWLAATFYQMRAASVVGWRTQLPVDSVAPSLADAEKVMRAFVAQGPTDDEMASISGELASEFTGAFDTAQSMAQVYGIAAAQGRPLDDVARAPARIRALTRDAVKAAAARYLDPDRQRVVIVGDWQKLREPLSALGWGNVEVRNVDGTRRSTEASHAGK